MQRPLSVNAAWTKQKSFAVGAATAILSVLLLCVLDRFNVAQNYGMSGLIFFPLFVCSVVILPAVAILVCYRRLMTASSAMMYSLGFGIGWYATFSLAQFVLFGVWKGFSPQQRTLANLIWRHSRSFIVIVAITMAANMAIWGIRRLVSGKVTLWREDLCSACGYDLTGNLSGKCPECGTQTGKGPTAV